MMHIDKKTHRVPKENYVKKEYDKTQIFIATSLRKDDRHLIRLKNKNLGNHKKWNCYTINRDGQIYEHYDPKYYSRILKNHDAEKQFISVVLENMGSLVKTEEGLFINSLGEECEPDYVGEKKWLGNKYWEVFPEEQIESLANLCKYLCKKFDIPLKVMEFSHFHERVINFKGIVFRSNYLVISNDINPFFNIEQFKELLNS